MAPQPQEVGQLQSERLAHLADKATSAAFSGSPWGCEDPVRRGAGSRHQPWVVVTPQGSIVAADGLMQHTLMFVHCFVVMNHGDLI